MFSLNDDLVAESPLDNMNNVKGTSNGKNILAERERWISLHSNSYLHSVIHIWSNTGLMRTCSLYFLSNARCYTFPSEWSFIIEAWAAQMV